MTVIDDTPAAVRNGTAVHDDIVAASAPAAPAGVSATPRPAAAEQAPTPEQAPAPEPPKASRWPWDSLDVIWALAVMIAVLVGAAAVVLSFRTLADLASRSGYPHDLAYLWSCIVDGPISLATMALFLLATQGREQRKNRQFFWAVLAAFATVSIGGNVVHALLPAGAPLPAWLIIAIAAVAPCSVLAMVHGVMVLGRLRASMRASANGIQNAATGAVGSLHDATAILIKHRNPDVKCIAERTEAQISEILRLVDEGEPQRSITRLTGGTHRRVIGRIAQAADEVRGGRVELDEDRDDD